ncbi:hypothetical protein WJ32_01395 [Burkholderia ubonensis]|uniref:Uncharacterized protein n=1 Tax=Burkholderia ubonensis TaxID=101571 RepID=A0A124R9L5_9BURK|nr:hypothetical protein WJ32_01395 [Burkholderia ubonensis]KVG61801.1 hypothetical protein WJ33_30915 [Burkholderia ubonensis]
MANSILASHPLSSLSSDSDLSIEFELRDPFHMPLDLLESLIESTEPGTEMRGYLFGLYDLRCAVVYARGH